MEYRFPLPKHLQNAALGFLEFANGAVQATARLKDGRVFGGVLISNATAIIAVRGYEEPPFEVEDIADLLQSNEDESPSQRSGWKFWDKWE